MLQRLVYMLLCIHKKVIRNQHSVNIVKKYFIESFQVSEVHISNKCEDTSRYTIRTKPTRSRRLLMLVCPKM